MEKNNIINSKIKVFLAFVVIISLTMPILTHAERGGVPPQPIDDLAPKFISQPKSEHYVIKDSGYAAPMYSVTVGLPEDAQNRHFSLQWFVEGVPYGEPIEYSEGPVTSTFTANMLTEKECGVYPIWCEAVRDVGGEKHVCKSYTTNFIVCTGVIPNSVLTFSDVHEVWDNLGQALRNTMEEEGGRIPALVIATGDYNNRYVAGYNDVFIQKCIDTMINRIRLQLGGIDTVWVSGNHDNGYATGFTNANMEEGLGLDENHYFDVDGGSDKGTVLLSQI